MESNPAPPYPAVLPGGRPPPVDHVGVAVHSIAESVPVFERLFGASSSPVQALPAQGVDVCFVGTLELLEPHGPETHVARFLTRSGPGLHHVAFRVADVRAELARLAAAGVRLVDEEPRPGAHGHLVAFLHPGDTGRVLIELVQR